MVDGVTPITASLAVMLDPPAAFCGGVDGEWANGEAFCEGGSFTDSE